MCQILTAQAQRERAAPLCRLPTKPSATKRGKVNSPASVGRMLNALEHGSNMNGRTVTGSSKDGMVALSLVHMDGSSDPPPRAATILQQLILLILHLQQLARVAHPLAASMYAAGKRPIRAAGESFAAERTVQHVVFSHCHLVS